MVQTVNVVLLIPWAKESVLEQPGLICLPNGVLSVTSEGAYCSDGERWGQAENGLQEFRPQDSLFMGFQGCQQWFAILSNSFIRVESCGR